MSKQIMLEQNTNLH